MRHVAGGSGTRPPRRTAPNPPARARCGAAYAVDGYPSAGVSPSGAGLWLRPGSFTDASKSPSPLSVAKGAVRRTLSFEKKKKERGQRFVDEE